jgi:hypothetical protein
LDGIWYLLRDAHCILLPNAPSASILYAMAIQSVSCITLCCAANLHDIGADILSRRRHLSAPFSPCPSHITVYLGNPLRMYLVPELPPAYFLVYQT